MRNLEFRRRFERFGNKLVYHSVAECEGEVFIVRKALTFVVYTEKPGEIPAAALIQGRKALLKHCLADEILCRSGRVPPTYKTGG